MSAAFDPSDLGQRRFTSFGLSAFPDPRDADLDEFVRSLWNGGESATSAALAAVSEKGRQVLRVYAERAANRAVRESSRDLLVLAAIALIVGGLDQNELDALTRMALVDDAARRLRIELADVFEDVAGVVGHPGGVNLMLWLSRAPEDRTPECMGFVAAQDETGFRYRWIS